MLKHFANLYAQLDSTGSTSAKQLAVREYFMGSDGRDAAWAVFFLAGGRPMQLVPTRVLKQAAKEVIGIEDWLFQECYDAVGDLSEVLHLLLPQPSAPQELSLTEWLAHLFALRGKSPDAQREALKEQWHSVPTEQRLVYFKLIMGAFRVGISRLQVTQALASVAQMDAKIIAQRLISFLALRDAPQACDYERLLSAESPEISLHPYPFFLAQAVLDDRVGQADFGSVSDWIVEWKWDGIRAQLLKRDGKIALWSRGEELITDRFPDLIAGLELLPDGTTLDGELVIAEHRSDRLEVRPFAQLQRRIGRKRLSAALCKELPAKLVAFDILEWEGSDQRDAAQGKRRALLEHVHANYGSPQWAISPRLQADSWTDLRAQRLQARIHNSEGLMLKASDARYGIGRTKASGIWWKWKLDPYSIDAVLIYAQKGHGRRGGLFSDYTFAVWSAPPSCENRHLIPFAKAYSGLTDAQLREVDAIINKTTREAFGPVRSVKPTMVFEIGFEGISASSRHSSGVATRFPRILRWRQDKKPEDADTLDTLLALAPTGL